MSRLKRYYYILRNLGIDPYTTLLSIYNLPYYIKSYINFRRNYRGRIVLYPCLLDRHLEAGDIGNEYFWQDLFVSRWVYEANPTNHLDVGSRIDGFVAHIATFRKVDVVDIRPLQAKIPNVRFIQCDLTDIREIKEKIGIEVYESISCLHTIEHVGLGRYGDKVDIFLYKVFLSNLSQILKNHGTLYISFPVGRERVEFNAHRIFHPLKMKHELEELKLKIQEFYVLERTIMKMIKDDEEILELATKDYRLAILNCKKIA
ncbi:MAG: DUF268 domain-containing protein [bacterium]